jgi:hypothetical protein
MVNYPLTVHSAAGRPTIYPNAAALNANYARVFTPDVKAAVAAAKPDNLFARDLGVMIGDEGEIWINEIGRNRENHHRQPDAVTGLKHGEREKAASLFSKTPDLT